MHGAVATRLVDDAGGVTQQILNRYLPHERHELELPIALHTHTLIPKLGNEF